MKNLVRTFVFSSALLFVSTAAFADFPATVQKIAAEKAKTVTVSSKLEAGAKIDDLSWASKSSMACFPATQNAKFRANHVLFGAQLPTRSVMTITVVPKDPKADLSIYAYTIGANAYDLPPNVSSAVSCEAEHKWDYPKRGKTQDHTRTISLTAIQNPYNVVIGVSGPAGAAGEFDLKVEVK